MRNRGEREIRDLICAATRLGWAGWAASEVEGALCMSRLELGVQGRCDMMRCNCLGAEIRYKGAVSKRFLGFFLWDYGLALSQLGMEYEGEVR